MTGLSVPVPAIKAGVDISALQPQMAIAFFIACAVYASHGYGVTLTSGREGKHGRGSLHYVGMAIDLRINTLPSMAVKQRVCDDLALALGEQFDVVLESSHIHCEYQPK
jgi:hypothetical protein